MNKALQKIATLSFLSGFVLYGMASLFVIDVLELLNISVEESIKISAGFFTIMYCFSVIPGHLSDRYLSPKKVAMTGILLMSAGVAIPVLFGKNWLLFGIAVMGFGYVCSNIKYVLIDNLFPASGRSRDNAFYVNYAAQEAGGIFGPVVMKLLLVTFGWQVAFSLASVIAMLSFINLKSLAVRIPQSFQRRKAKYNKIKSLLLVLLCVAVSSFALENIQTLDFLTSVVLLGVAILYFRLIRKYSGKDKRNLFVMSGVVLAVIIFYSLYFQVVSTLPFKFANNTNRLLFSFQIPDTWLLPIEAVFIVIAATFVFKRNIGERLSSVNKLLLGLLLGGVAFLLFGLIFYSNDKTVHWILPVLACIPLGVGEVFITPIMSEMVTKLSPPGEQGLLNGLSQTSFAFSGSLASMLGLSLVTAGDISASRYVPLSLSIIALCLLVFCVVRIKQFRTSTSNYVFH